MSGEGSGPHALKEAHSERGAKRKTQEAKPLG